MNRRANPPWALWSVGVIYSAIVLACASRHEAWFDEAQSWLLARDASVPDLLIRYMRYEGTPALWQCLLMPFAKNGFPYPDMSFISAALAIIGVALFLWRAPFPLWIRLLFPFTYFPLFQYSVVARSYALFLPLIFGIAVLFPKRVSVSPILYCVLLALLANASFHGTILAAILFLEWLWTAWKWGTFRTRPALGWCIASSFALLYLALFLELRLPADFSDRLADSHTFKASVSRVMKQISEAFWGGLGSSLYRVFSTLAGLAVLAVSLFQFRKSLASFFLCAMTALLLALAGFRQAAAWHAGIIFLVWIFSLWIYFEQSPGEASRARSLKVVIAVVFITQSIFGLQSVWFDFFHAYPEAVPQPLSWPPPAWKIESYTPSASRPSGIQPYFDRNVFERQEHGRREAFYSWTKLLDHDRFADLAQQHPDIVVLAPWNPPAAEKIDQLGYCEQTRFEGSIWWKNAIGEPDSYSLMVLVIDRDLIQIFVRVRKVEVADLPYTCAVVPELR